MSSYKYWKKEVLVPEAPKNIGNMPKKNKRVSFDAQKDTFRLTDFIGGTDAPAAVTTPILTPFELDTRPTFVEINKGERDGDKNFDANAVILKIEKAKFNKERAELRSYYKKLKVGIIKFDAIPIHYQKLLEKYYGVG